MKLKVPKKFIKDFFGYLFFSILADCYLWGNRSSVILKPIFILKIIDFKLISWKPINKFFEKNFQITKIRDDIKNVINYSDGSELEQVLIPIDKNIFELDDNPLIYPGERLKKFFTEFIQKDSKIINYFNGLCHFQPIDIRFSRSEMSAMKEISRIMKNYNKDYIVSLIIEKGNPRNYIKETIKSKTSFVKFMLNNLDNTLIRSDIYYPDNSVENIGVSII